LFRLVPRYRRQPNSAGTSLARSSSAQVSPAGTGNNSDTSKDGGRDEVDKARTGGASGVGGGPPLNALLAVGRDTVLPGGVPGAVVPGLSALDLFQLALALIVGMVFRRFLA